MSNGESQDAVTKPSEETLLHSSSSSSSSSSTNPFQIEREKLLSSMATSLDRVLRKMPQNTELQDVSDIWRKRFLETSLHQNRTSLSLRRELDLASEKLFLACSTMMLFGSAPSYHPTKEGSSENTSSSLS